MSERKGPQIEEAKRQENDFYSSTPNPKVSMTAKEVPAPNLYKINENEVSEPEIHQGEDDKFQGEDEEDNDFGDDCVEERMLKRVSSFDEEGSVNSTSDRNASDFMHSVDALFDFLTEDNQTVSVASIFSTLRRCGLRTNDPRLKGMMNELYELEKIEQKIDISLLVLSKEEFRMCVMPSFTLIRKALHMQMIIPRWTEFCNQITGIYEHCKHINQGIIADYIPQTAKADPKLWAVSMCTVDGQRYSWGDCKTPFCLQALSSVLSYAIVRHELGAEEVHKYIGQEPSGRLFNEICLDHLGRPHNPLINAGAIVTASLLKRQQMAASRFDHVMDMAKKFCGGTFVGFDNSTFISEKMTADRNFALSYFMREKECFPEGTDLQSTLDLYLQLCSLQSNTDALAVFAATLANGGICPLTGEIVVSMEATRDTLTLMYSCGLYAHSGQFSFRVGLPAKSGVSGVMMVVVPNVMGFCLFSPKLTQEGNSFRSVKFCEKLVDTFTFHNYDIMRTTNSERDPRRQTTDSQREQIMKIMFSSQAGDLSALKRYALQGLNLNCSDYDNRTPLHMAAAEGHDNIVRFLLESCNVQVDPRDRWDRTPFDDALEFGHEQCAKLLDEYKRKYLAENGDENVMSSKMTRKISVMYAVH